MKALGPTLVDETAAVMMQLYSEYCYCHGPLHDCGQFVDQLTDRPTYHIYITQVRSCSLVWLMVKQACAFVSYKM